MDLRFYLALLIGKFISLILKAKGGGATAAPGLYALYIDPHFVKKFSKKIPHGSIIVSGTNGKTTTARISHDILSSKYKIIYNRQGSNLLRGLASTFINNSSFFGKTNAEIALWEADEALLPQIAESTNPKVIILLNLFRDQLDRYGEVESIRNSWQKMVEKLPKNTKLILNEDDPGIKYLSKFTKCNIKTFGILDDKINLPEIKHKPDLKQCPNCDSKIDYLSTFSAHIGIYQCSFCSFKRELPKVYAKNLNFAKGFKSSFYLTSSSHRQKISLNLPGLYNIYNVLAAASLADFEKINANEFKKIIETFSAAFGRFQKFKIHDKKAIIFLIKNPTGANEVIRTIAKEKRLNILAILNDNIADGRDVSWIWDADWESLKDKIEKVTVSGTRRWDLATRFKYADVVLSKINVYSHINYSINKSLENLNTNDTLLILPTYTALLQSQKILSKMASQKKWHKE